MFLEKIPVIVHYDDENSLMSVNALIEISMGESYVKYEFDDCGALRVDRFLSTPLYYPCNYGFIPNTKSGDGDSLDILIITRYPVISGSIIEVLVVGALIMEDESGPDEKIIAVPAQKIDRNFVNVCDINDISDLHKEQILHFFKYYKSCDDGKWTSVTGFGNAKIAIELINKAINNGFTK